MIRTKGRRRLACYHEAGHALARWYLGHSTESLHVLTVEEVRSGKGIEDSRGRLILCEGLCMGYDIAPYVFETPENCALRDNPEKSQWLLNAKLRAASMGMVVNVAGAWAEARYRHCSLGVVLLTGASEDYAAFKQTRDTWFPVDAIAAGALALEQAAALIRSAPGWRAIEAMAEPLYEVGELDGETCDKLCAAAYGVECGPDLGAIMDAWPIAPAAIRAGWLPA